MNPRTLAQLRTSVVLRGQYENSNDINPAGNSALLNELINEGVQEFWDIIVGKWQDQYTIISPTFSLVQGTDTYQLDTFNSITGVAPAFYKLRKVEILMAGSGVPTDSTNRWKRLLPASLDAQHAFSQWGLVANGYRYRIQGPNIVFMPMPMSPAIVRLFYIPYATRLVADSDTFDGINGYEELVVQLALMRCKQREELPTDEIEREIQRLWARVRTADDGVDNEPFYLSPSGPGYGADDDESSWWW